MQSTLSRRLFLPLLALGAAGGFAQAQDHVLKHHTPPVEQQQAVDNGIRPTKLGDLMSGSVAPWQEVHRDTSRAVDTGLRPMMIGEPQEPNLNPTNAGVACGAGCNSYLLQSPNQSNGIFAEASCNLCGGPQVLADQFTVSSNQDVCTLNVWGGYFPSNTTPADSFTLIVHSDAAGLPGGVVYSESNVPSSRATTGIVLFGVDEWEYTLTPSATISLLSGNTYWIELYNDTVASADDWFWEVGNVASPGLAGSGFAFEAPGVNWNFDSANSFALQVCSSGPIDPPDCNDFGCTELLNQTPNQSNGIFSEANCSICAGPQVVAEQFTSSVDQDLCSISFWGGYFPTNTSPADDFTLIVHQSSAGLPGAVVYSESSIGTSRGLTGVSLFGVSEWQYTAIPASTISLLAGNTYWIEIYNDTVASADDWFWETGNLAAPGIAGSTFAFEAPGVNWGVDAAQDLALHLCSTPTVAPECTVGCDERINQPANSVNGYFSDMGCDFCGTGQQSLAESVILSQESELCDIKIRSGYFPDNIPVVDNLTLIISADSAGLPGAVAYSESGISAARVMTGNVLFGVDEWIHTLTPAAVVCLSPGKYWIEIFNDTGFTGSDFFWETGDTDVGGGGEAGCLFAVETPGITWNAVPDSLSLVVCAQACGGLGTKYCTANNNSTGSPADISASGSASSGAGDLTLTSAPVPNQNGVFFHGSGQAAVPFGNGFLCATGNVKRGLVVGAAGNTVSYTYDNSLLKKDLSAHIGTTRNFQHWTRDPMGGGALHNTSNGISIDILP
jgi:hypothetical protein